MYAIAAMSSNRVIGKDNGMPWPRSKEDFAFFREKTMNKCCIVGSTTFRHLPLLKDRSFVVVSKERLCNEHINPLYKGTSHGMHPCIEGSEMMQHLTHNKQFGGLEHVVIGGGKIYELTMPLWDSLFLTKWNFEVEGDTFMPPFEHLFPVCEKIKDIEDGKGTIWEYKSKAKFEADYPGIELL